MISYSQAREDPKMARPLSQKTRKVLAHIGRAAGSSLDELAARSGIRKAKLAKLLWHLQGAGWIAASEELRCLVVYRRLRDIPRALPPARDPIKTAAHIQSLNAAFGIRLPAKRARGRTIRRGE